MIAYHFTSVLHLPRILGTGALLPTESNISIYEDHAGPDVVWLLDTPDLGGFVHGLTLGLKDRIRFTVDVPAIKWDRWGPVSAMDADWREILVKGGGGPEAAEHWYVFPMPIRRRRWVAVDDLLTGEPVDWQGES